MIKFFQFSKNADFVLVKLTDLNDLNDNDYVMINPAGLDHSMLPDERPLIAKIVEVNREDDYIDAEWMMMVSVEYKSYFDSNGCFAL